MEPRESSGGDAPPSPGPTSLFPALQSFEAFKGVFQNEEIGMQEYASLRHYLDTGEMPANEKVDWKLLQVAIKLRMDRLVFFCEKTIFGVMTPQDTFPTLFRANELGATLLKSAILKYLVKNREFFNRRVGWWPLYEHPQLLQEYLNEENNPYFEQTLQFYTSSFKANKYTLNRSRPTRNDPSPSGGHSLRIEDITQGRNPNESSQSTGESSRQSSEIPVQQVAFKRPSGKKLSHSAKRKRSSTVEDGCSRTVPRTNAVRRANSRLAPATSSDTVFLPATRTNPHARDLSSVPHSNRINSLATRLRSASLVPQTYIDLTDDENCPREQSNPNSLPGTPSSGVLNVFPTKSNFDAREMSSVSYFDQESRLLVERRSLPVVPWGNVGFSAHSLGQPSPSVAIQVPPTDNSPHSTVISGVPYSSGGSCLPSTSSSGIPASSYPYPSMLSGVSLTGHNQTKPESHQYRSFSAPLPRNDAFYSKLKPQGQGSTPHSQPTDAERNESVRRQQANRSAEAEFLPGSRSVSSGHSAIEDHRQNEPPDNHYLRDGQLPNFPMYSRPHTAPCFAQLPSTAPSTQGHTNDDPRCHCRIGTSANSEHHNRYHYTQVSSMRTHDVGGNIYEGISIPGGCHCPDSSTCSTMSPGDRNENFIIPPYNEITNPVNVIRNPPSSATPLISSYARGSNQLRQRQRVGAQLLGSSSSSSGSYLNTAHYPPRDVNLSNFQQFESPSYNPVSPAFQDLSLTPVSASELSDVQVDFPPIADHSLRTYLDDPQSVGVTRQGQIGMIQPTINVEQIHHSIQQTSNGGGSTRRILAEAFEHLYGPSTDFTRYTGQ